MSAHDFSFTSLDGRKLPLGDYRGRPLLVVNTASFCGFTPQYADLEALWRRYRARGLVIIGVPSNDFGEQEPGSAQEIGEFCRSRYAVDFPLTEKQTVIGPDAHPFFRWIADTLGEAGAPRWNFHKFLVAPDGSLAGAWPSAVRPGDPAIIEQMRSRRVMFGNILQPDECWMLDGRLPTVSLRMNRQSKNAQRIAERLFSKPQIRHVYYPTLYDDDEQIRIRLDQCDYPGGIWDLLRKGLEPKEGDSVILCGAALPILASLGAVAAATTLL
jgi:glutathione peroxidase